MNAPAHFQRMQRRFEEAAEREHVRRAARRTRHRVVATGAAVLAAAVVALVIVNLANPSAQASTVHVDRTGDQVTVRLVGLVSDAHQLAADLADAGVPADVTVETTGPSRAGTILSVVMVDAGQDRVVRQDPHSFTYVVSAGARATLLLGVRAVPGAPYDQPVDATASGEPLHCRIAVGDPVSVARTHVALEGITVSWTLARLGASPTPLDAAALGADEAAQLFVQSARRLADDRIEITMGDAAQVGVPTTGCG